jgi:hypothetical protein
MSSTMDLSSREAFIASLSGRYGKLPANGKLESRSV